MLCACRITDPLLVTQQGCKFVQLSATDGITSICKVAEGHDWQLKHKMEWD